MVASNTWPLPEVFDYLSDIIILLDEEQTVLDVNHLALKYFNCTKSQLLGYPYSAVCQSQKLEPIENLANSAASTKNTVGQTIAWRIIDRKVLIGKILSDSELYLSSILTADYAGLNIYWLDKENRLILSNDCQARAIGFQTNDELRGKTVTDFCNILGYGADIEKAVCQNNQQIISSGKSYTFEEGSDSTHWYLSYKAPFFDFNQQIQGILGISTNITERKALETKLIAAKHATDTYLESILLSSRNNIYWMDVDGRIIGCNDQQAKCFGLENRMDLIGKNIFDVGALLNWDPDLPKKIRENDINIMKNSHHSIHEETVILNGKKHIYLASKSPMYNQAGELVGIMGIATDITELKQITQELEQAKLMAETANRYKTEFIANISHDIRTPLVGIQGIAAWLAEKIPPEFLPEINGLIKASNELLNLLNNVIHLTKLEFDDPKKIKSEPFNLRELISGLVALFAVVAQQKKLSLNVNYPDDLPDQFVSAPYLVQQTILNLLSNALKFTNQGHVTVHISKDPDLEIKDQIFPLLITIEDTGIGIPEQSFEEIFKSFHRLDPTYKDQHYGSGLGLAIVRQLVAKLSGRVWVTSKVNEGSNFFVSLPLLLSQKPAVSSGINGPLINPADLLQSHAPLSIQQAVKPHHLLILLVEDNVLIQKGVTSLLNKLNCYVDIAGTAYQALELAKRETYDLIFMDIGLPDQDGFWTTRQIRQSLIHYAHTPIIALTAHLDEEYRNVCQEAGINDIITKPLTIDGARACFKQYLQPSLAEIVCRGNA